MVNLPKHKRATSSGMEYKKHDTEYFVCHVHILEFLSVSFKAISILGIFRCAGNVFT